MAASLFQQATNTAATSPLSATWPATPTSGDVLLALVDSDTTMTSGPTGYTTLASNVGGQGAYVYEKTAGASESTTLTVTPNGANLTALLGLEITGTSGRDTISAVTSAQATTNTSVNIASITTGAGSGNGDLVLAVVMLHTSVATGAIGSTPTWSNGFTTLTVAGTTTTSSGLTVVTFVGSKQVTSSTAVGATTCTWTNSLSSGDSSTWMIGYTNTTSAGGSVTMEHQPPHGRARFRAANW